ncbi:MAG TPA: CDP-alcohol phosphatidyltransferase family protein [Methanomassiliicoccales archaeon]|nr:CDP-alcohol phosphatidyltransferase family protein [Methanomassiliicoccales archaeon]
MVLDSHRSKVDFIMDPVAKAMVKVPPDHISLIALALAALAGALLYLSHAHWELLPVAAVVVLVSGFFDGLDGKVARLVGKADRTGDFLDHVLDRYADMLMIGGVAVSAWCSPYLGMMALVGVLLTSYMGTQAQAVGAKRMYAGLLGGPTASCSPSSRRSCSWAWSCWARPRSPSSGTRSTPSRP